MHKEATMKKRKNKKQEKARSGGLPYLNVALKPVHSYFTRGAETQRVEETYEGFQFFILQNRSLPRDRSLAVRALYFHSYDVKDSCRRLVFVEHGPTRIQVVAGVDKR